MKFFTTMQLGPKQSTTPEGYLVCHDVPITRTGELLYRNGEVPIPPGPDGLTRITRDSAEVFRAETIASFEGKPVTDEHPASLVNAATHNIFSRGTVINVRQGVGDQADLMLADLLITNENTIKDVRSGKRAVSAGYDADYTQDSPGRGRQSNIVGNHVALVNVGRAGSRCSIGDEAMKGTLVERFEAAKVLGDQTAIDKLFAEAMSGTPGGQPVNVVIHNSTPVGRKTTKDEGEEGTEEAAKDPLDEIREMLKSLVTRLDAVEKAVNTNADEHEKSGDEMVKVDGEGGHESADDDAEPGEGTKDSGAGLLKVLAEVRSRAEILSPGIQIPTLDGERSVKEIRKTVRTIRATALDKAYSAAEGKAVIDAMTGAKAKPDFTKMPTKDARLLFNGASESMRSRNNSGANRATLMVGRQKTGNLIAQVQTKNRDFWAKH